ncbi:adenosine deaminase/editase [Abortiporus biennis]|nr:adenosine deaminase/editase [Abortiporus biennis]
MVVLPPDHIVEHVQALYTSLAFKPPPQKWTILAAFVLTNIDTGALKVISLASGSKCLPATRLVKEGDVLHDSHAEVLARRGALRWFLEEVQRSMDTKSEWLRHLNDGLLSLAQDVQLVLYVSMAPCGDASMRYLASFQDPEMAALKDSSQFPVLPPNAASRGRDNYTLYGVLRTKPGRADSPPTSSMSCSDKISLWNFVGIQGALGSRFLRPIYIDRIIIGDVTSELRPLVFEDCERAFWGRLSALEGNFLIPSYKLHHPIVEFTDLPFIHSHTSLPTATSSCNDSLCWVADSSRSSEILINGVKRGVPPKHIHLPKFRPILSKISLLSVYQATLSAFGHEEIPASTYRQIKHSLVQYQAAKSAIQGSEGPFSGWVKSGSQCKCFDSNGTLHEDFKKTA